MPMVATRTVVVVVVATAAAVAVATVEAKERLATLVAAMDTCLVSKPLKVYEV